MKKRCFNCSKKTLICEFCKCNTKDCFCLDCVPFYKHKCSYDWRQNKKDSLIEDNPQIIASKLQII